MIEISGITDPEKIMACHCTDYQVLSGVAFKTSALCGKSNFSITGTPKEFVKIGDNGNKRIQSFCGKCRPHLFATDLNKSIFNIKVGFLNQRDDLMPSKHIFGSSVQ